MNNPFEYFKVLVSVKRNLADSMKPTTSDKQAELRGRVLAYNDVIDEINKIEEMFIEESATVSFSDKVPDNIKIERVTEQTLDV